MPRSHHDSQVCWPICVSLDGYARFTGVDLILWLDDAHDVIRHYSYTNIYKRLYLQKCQGKHNNVFLTTMVDIAQQLYIQL